MRPRHKKVLVVFICKDDLDSVNSKVLWVTAEAIPRVKDEGEFLENSKELIGRLTREGVMHELQDHKSDLERLEENLEEVTRYNGPIVFITPERGRYRRTTMGGEVVEIEISRLVDISKWRKIGHRKNFPEIKNGRYKIFLDTVSFTGRTISEVDKQYNINIAGIELVGKYAIENVHKNIRIPIIRAQNVPDFDGVWHLDDFVQEIETEDGFMKPSEFVGNAYGKLKHAKDRDEFGKTLLALGIKTEQTSPNLFLELSRPDSYLARSFNPEGVQRAVDLIERMQNLYRGKNGN